MIACSSRNQSGCCVSEGRLVSTSSGKKTNWSIRLSSMRWQRCWGQTVPTSLSLIRMVKSRRVSQAELRVDESRWFNRLFRRNIKSWCRWMAQDIQFQRRWSLRLPFADGHHRPPNNQPVIQSHRKMWWHCLRSMKNVKKPSSLPDVG